jgi:hypothetical protein
MINERQRKKKDNDDKRFTRTVIHKFFVGDFEKKKENRERERRDIYVYVFIMSNTEERERKKEKKKVRRIYTHYTYTRRSKCVSSFSVL